MIIVIFGSSCVTSWFSHVPIHHFQQLLLSCIIHLFLFTFLDWQFQEDPSPLKINYLVVALGFGVAVFLLEYYLDSRQLYNYRNIKSAPKSLEGVVPHEKFVQSSAYGADKLAFGCFEGSCVFLEGVALVLLGWLPYAWCVK